MVLKPEPFKELKNGEFQDFRGWTEVQPKLDCDDIIMN